MTLLASNPKVVRAARLGAAGLLISAALFMWTTRAGHAAGHAVEMTGNSFQPEAVSAAVGDAITWTNRDPETHSVVGGPINSPDIPPGATFSYTVSQAGDISYTCRFHPYMTGTIHVTGGGGASSPPPTSPPPTSPPATSPPATAAPANPPPTSAPAVTTTTAPAGDASDDEAAEPDDDPTGDDAAEEIDDEDVDESVDFVAEDDASDADPRAASSTATTRKAGSAAATTTTSPPRAAIAAFPSDLTYVEPAAPVEEMTDNGPLTAVAAPPLAVATSTTTTPAPTTTAGPDTVEPHLSSTSATRKIGGVVAMTAALGLVAFLLRGRVKRRSP
ncbi:MAG TPA: cupredoxin domain-containing protein [Acidimicrobiales bacterium]|nr:cupredoxin domain-containing protein [Acidimicrobiales bacterium]